MKNRFFLAIATVIAAVVMSSCAKVPQEALDAAKSSLESARAAQTDIYFPAEYADLNDQLAVLHQNIETKKSKSAGDFKEIKAAAETIARKAADLSANVEERKAEVKAEAEKMLTEAHSLLDEARTLITKAPKGKEGKAAIDEMKEELGVLENSLNDAKALFEEGANYQQVVDKVKAADENARKVIGELKNAMQKAGIKI